MTADEIREIDEHADNNPVFLAEIAAQLAELNESIRVLVDLLRNK